MFRVRASSTASAAHRRVRSRRRPRCRARQRRCGARSRRDRVAGSASARPIRLVVPITLAVLACLLVEADDQRFAVPLHRVVVAQAEQAVGDARRGSAVPVARRRAGAGQPAGRRARSQRPSRQRPGPTIVVSGTLQRHAFQVDALVGHRDVVVKGAQRRAAPARRRRRHEHRARRFGARRARSARPRRTGPPPRHATSGPRRDVGQRRPRHRVLVVDDALTVRELQRSILERAGFDVVVAVDGVDALARLARGDVDLVLTDVQMPRMDGFALTRAVPGAGRRWRTCRS